ncbi:type II toxin-antitoxin system VapC family toxin [Pelagibacterium halotolerans]|uniref:type II toxin-antitoxin system VapC family toxin n=1 Tax=Pelagibacterium halotolerans TaxID=531813 RepID=UPI00385102E8
MFIDASVIVAILLGESDAAAFETRLEEAGGPFFISPLVRYEATVSIARAKAIAGNPDRAASAEIMVEVRRGVETLIDTLQAREIAISSDIGRLALDAAALYGKAVGHRARLNFGDCYSYACAKAYRLELLYKGDDFAHTDLA